MICMGIENFHLHLHPHYNTAKEVIIMAKEVTIMAKEVTLMDKEITLMDKEITLMAKEVKEVIIMLKSPMA
jgi:hypothetical protein